MLPQPVSLRSFLSSARTTLKDAIKHSSPVTFVVGNESADLDSICSAVYLAYLRTYAPTSKIFHIPLLNLPRVDLGLRPEILPVLKHANFGVEDLITLDELGKVGEGGPLKPEETRWILVDHNAMQGELGKIYAKRVVGCIDHHDEENKVPRNCEGETRVVTPCGSCASLVVKECMGTWAGALRKDDGACTWNSELAKLAMAPILIDTNNLKNKFKTKPADTAAVEYLEKCILVGSEEKWDSKTYFEEISEAKEDIGGLSLDDILRKDYKQWTESSIKLGVSSVVKDISFLILKADDKAKFFATVEKFANERGLSIYSIMTTSHQEGKLRRELFVCALDESGVDAAKKFEADSKEKLQLRTWKEGDLDIVDNGNNGQWRKCWWQLKVEHSRKQVAPLLRTVINL